MNLDHTIAITQNYVSSSNFAVSWRWTRKGRPKLSQKWLERLRSVRPDLYSIAIDIEDSKDYDGYPTATSSSSTDSSDNEE
jgi:histone arginine demethylase JMJD6